MILTQEVRPRKRLATFEKIAPSTTTNTWAESTPQSVTSMIRSLVDTLLRDDDADVRTSAATSPGRLFAPQLRMAATALYRPPALRAQTDACERVPASKMPPVARSASASPASPPKPRTSTPSTQRFSTDAPEMRFSGGPGNDAVARRALGKLIGERRYVDATEILTQIRGRYRRAGMGSADNLAAWHIVLRAARKVAVNDRRPSNGAAKEFLDASKRLLRDRAFLVDAKPSPF